MDPQLLFPQVAGLPTEICAAVFAGEERLAEPLEDQVVSLGDAVVPWLIALATNSELADMNAPGKGLAPVHATRLLAVLRAPSAVTPLVDALAPLDWDDTLYGEICLALPRFGAALLGPALAALAESPSESTREALCSALAESGVKDECIFRCLTALFVENPPLGAYAFRQYGDERAVPLLEERLRAFEIDDHPALSRSELLGLIDAYGQLAGSMPADLEEHVASLRVTLESAIADAARPDDSDEAATPTFIRRLENAPGKPWLCASTCTDPDCECRDATLFLAKERTALRPVTAWIEAGEAGKSLWDHLRSEPIRGVTMVVIDIDSGSMVPLPVDAGESIAIERPPDDDGAAEATRLVASLDGELLDDLNDHWCDGKDIDTETTWPVAELPWRRGESLAYSEVFFWTRPDAYNEGQHFYALVERYCPLPECDCNEVTLEWLELGRTERALCTVRHTLGSPLPGPDTADPLMARLWTRFLLRYPHAEQRFTERQRRMKAYGARLLAHRAARRPEELRSKWVSSSKKGRQGNKGRKGKKK